MMSEVGFRRQAPLTVGLDRRTSEPISLEQALAEPDAVAQRSDLTVDQRIAVVRRRWEDGAWGDVDVCDEQVDLERGIRELEGRTALGEDLFRLAERAIEMVFEDAGMPERP